MKVLVVKKSLYLTFCLLFFLTISSASADSLLTTIGNPVTRQSTIFRSNVNPTFDFETGATGGTVTSIVFQMNDTSNADFGYPDSIATSVELQILSGATVLDTFVHSSYDAGTMRVTLTGSAALNAYSTYTLKLGCSGCANTGFDQTSTNATGWQFTSDYYETGYPIILLDGSVGDTTSPTFTFNPSDSATNVAVDANITVTFDEPIRNLDDSALTDANVDALITLKDTDAGGTDIAFDATIDGNKKVITINPTSNFTSEQTVYVAIGVTVEDSSDNAITAGNATFTTADTASPTVTFAPLDSATDVAVDSDITITFNDAVRNTDDSEITDSNVDALITLKDTNAGGSNIAFDATINAGKTIITIDPDSDFSSEQVVYVAIGATVEDASDNAIAASNATFTAADTVAPTVTFSPLDSATDVAVDSDITITFNEAMRNTDDSALTDSNVDALITLKDTNAGGSNIDFDATINAGKTIITIDPDSDFSSEQVVYVAIGATVEDASDNAIAASNATFTAADTVAPTVTFSPLDSATDVAADSDITITFNDAVRNTDDSEITDSNVDALITLKDTNAGGSNIDFDATINAGKTIITIDPASDFSSEQVVYVAIGATVEDASDNAITASNATFTVIAAAANDADDSDGDGINDDDEGTDDTDNDGTPDYLDSDSDGDGIEDSDEGNVDTDSDGTPDHVDSDSDGDGIEDSVEGNVDTDSDGTPDYKDTESDGDGVDDGLEINAPNNGDGNNDGTPDHLQNRVSSLIAYNTLEYVTLESQEGTTLTGCQVTDNPSPDDMPAGSALSYGLFDFTINGVGAGGSVQMTIYLPAAARPKSYTKYGMTPDDNTDHWYAFMYDGVSGAEINENVITLYFVDAEKGDDILTQDGLVVDLGGPLFDSSSGNGNSSGCFLGSISYR